MALLQLMRGVAAVMVFVHWADSDSHRTVATCHQQTRASPEEWDSVHRYNPSAVQALTADLSAAHASLTVRWAIRVDASIHNLTGTWITWISHYGEVSKFYRCEYQPPFTSGGIRYAGLEQMWFSFTVSNVTACPSTQHHISAYNLPTPPTNTGHTFIKHTTLGESDISAYNLPTPPTNTGHTFIKHTTLVESDWSAHVHSVLHDDKIVVTFNASSAADRHTIYLRDRTRLLNTAVEKWGCNVGECRVELEYTGPCEDLTVEITAHFEHCLDGSDDSHSVPHEVNCMNRSGWVIGVVCVLALLLVLLCCCIIICQVQRRVRGSKRGASVRVLLVYPAVDGVFQRAVMSLAQLLQSRGGITVAIDVWDRGSLAKQGPLRWLNTQAELADRVLIISAPQRSHTDNPKSLISDMTDDTVSASASNLFTLTLNLVSSAAHDPHGRDKFWVINLQHNEKSVQTELRGCRTSSCPEKRKSSISS